MAGTCAGQTGGRLTTPLRLTREAPDDREKERRVLLIAQLMVGGMTPKQVLAAVLAKNISAMAWDLPLATIEHLIAEANDRLEEESAVNPQAQLGIAITRLNDLYKKAIDLKRIDVALAVESKRITLLGLDQVVPSSKPPPRRSGVRSPQMAVDDSHEDD